APLRSGTSSRATTSTDLFQRARRTVTTPSGARGAGGSSSSRAPGAKRSSGASVNSCTVTSPRMPWGLPTRATWTFMDLLGVGGRSAAGTGCGGGKPTVPASGADAGTVRDAAPDAGAPGSPSAGAVGVDDVDPDRTVLGEGAHHGAQRLGGAALAA